MDGVINETTDMIHKHKDGHSDFGTRCGATSHVAHDQLRLVSVERAASDSNVSRCGRCFDDAGGY
ncbi:hypothetical protein GS429_14660 [Natronorubrum sp. JWXQ-INN-674]|uniref:Uncharacterized protein n=1 Tax=Natronorubrum halalkaliphilum TaxID=2691917 RepID=A0A6B0VPS5_9EURY|nr:hypothetical protein [Natronorubrum halalkaliphilum]MXV63285.1 hypothetical protein [Natronorubrum halalkaliphilum]